MSRLLTRTELRLAVMTMLVATAIGVTGQAFTIRIIDLYGLNKVSAIDVRTALTFKEGDSIVLAEGERPSALKSSEERLAKLPGVVAARINVVCCDSGGVIAYVGIQEQGAPTLRLRPPPQGAVRLPIDIVQAGDEFSKAFMLAVQRGDAGEVRTQGHSLMHDPATRAIQERLLIFARRDLNLLRLVLRDSSDTLHRALAAQLLGYAADKQSVVDDLVRAMTDGAEEVRNNAMRALMVFAEAVPGQTGSRPRIPTGPFVEFLNSPVWSDRNKASLALMATTERRDQGVLAEVRRSALTQLAEMARWKSEGHALPAFMILARLAGYSDEEAHGFWERRNAEVVIEAAIRTR